MTSPSVAAPRPLLARATPDRARRTELWMLLFAVLLGTLAVVAVNLGTGRPWASHVGLLVAGSAWASAWPISVSAGGRRRPTRCCSRWRPCSTAWGWR